MGRDKVMECIPLINVTRISLRGCLIDLRILLILEMALILDLSRILLRTKIDFLLKKRSFRTMIRSCARRWMTQLGV